MKTLIADPDDFEWLPISHRWNPSAPSNVPPRLSEALHAFIDQLTPVQRHAVVQTLLGASQREAAREWGSSQAAFSAALERAFQNLRTQLLPIAFETGWLN